MVAPLSVKGAIIPYTEISTTVKLRPFHDTLTLRRTCAERYARTSAFRIFSEALIMAGQNRK
jgi:hypothetical protein